MKKNIFNYLLVIVIILLFCNLVYLYVRFNSIETHYEKKVFELKTEFEYLSTKGRKEINWMKYDERKESFRDKIETFERNLNNLSVVNLYFF